MKKRTKILLGCAAGVVVPILVGVVAVAVFLISLGFGDMEPMRVVDTTGYSPLGGDGAAGYRVAAEWEPVLGALVAWPLAVPASLVAEIALDDTLFLLVDDEAARSEARMALAGPAANFLLMTLAAAAIRVGYAIDVFRAPSTTRAWTGVSLFS